MKAIIAISFLFFTIQISSQEKINYLQKHRQDMTDDSFVFPEENFKIIGFGAYHGSAKTEEVELSLLESLTKQKLVRNYLPETDFSTAYYFNKFMENGDTTLLKDLVGYYGMRVPQEKSIETYEKWIALKELNDRLSQEDKLRVLGIDKISNYKYPILHLLELISDSGIEEVKKLEALIKNKEAEFATYYQSETKEIIRKLILDYEKNRSKYIPYISDTLLFNHIIINLEETIAKTWGREKTIYKNYLALDRIYGFDQNPAFVRFGFFHLEKSREGKDARPSFFAMLIENEIYTREQVKSIIGYLTDSRVLWNEQYNKEGQYIGYSTKGGFGIGDYWKEYFRGIKKLKKTAISNMTLFQLNEENSPYNSDPDLMEIKLFMKRSNGKQLKDSNTLDFIDYAVLIRNSNANVPIQEL